MFTKLSYILKRIPTPTYGNYGGYYKRCRNKKVGICPTPIDKMDVLFLKHDQGMSNEELVAGLKRLKPTDMKHYVYGNSYRWSAWAVFSVAVYFSKF